MGTPLPLWQTHFTAEAATWAAEVARRLEIAPSDPVAQGIAWAAGRLQASIAQLADASRLVTPEVWGQLQMPPVSAQSVRRWIRHGELESVPSAQGSLVPVTARRHVKSTPLPTAPSHPAALDDAAA